ncbi:hypothetical protein AB1Y20_010682 [Prymnesium parvum]|uniref:Uncharacterized protein n=1 Tax=Prymnesium parvum TaxID=97485 RepID=A0AB34IRQ9_PRYPA
MLRAERLFSVAGKRVLLTGGGRGIGKMMAAGLLSNGAHVVIASRDEKALEAAVEELKSSIPDGGQCSALRADLSSRAGCEKLVADYAAIETGEPPRCDVLINNSGLAWGEPLDNESGKMNWGWDRVLDVNVKAPFYLTRAMRPLLRVAPASDDGRDPARVINVGSVVGLVQQNVPTHAYDVSKAAMHHLTKKLAADLVRPEVEGARRITVNAIAPGYVLTKMSAGLSSWGANEATLAAGVPLGRCGDVADMVGITLYLSSPASSWVTGAIIPVDGGASGCMSIPVVPE